MPSLKTQVEIGAISFFGVAGDGYGAGDFALERRTSEVAGMVLVDSAHEDEPKRAPPFFLAHTLPRYLWYPLHLLVHRREQWPWNFRRGARRGNRCCSRSRNISPGGPIKVFSYSTVRK